MDGGGRDGWGELRSEPRAAHVFFKFQIKKELFIFQIKSISKGTFLKKGTKWQSLVNSQFILVKTFWVKIFWAKFIFVKFFWAKLILVKFFGRKVLG